MINLEFGKSELIQLERNSMFISFIPGSPTWNDDYVKISGFYNRKFNKATKEWEVPYTPETLADIQALFNNEINYLNERPRQANIALMNEFLDNYDWGKFKPYPYQLEGIKYGLTRRNWILADTMGLGKSFQTIHLANIYKQRGKLKHCLVICCINSLKYNWLNEIHKFTDTSAVILGTKHGKTEKTKNKLYETTTAEMKEQIDNCPEEFFWIMNIEKLRLANSKEKSREYINSVVASLNKHIASGNLGMIIIDEIHTCRNIKSQQAKGLLALDNKAIKVGMSGTLIVNNPLNLYVPMSVVGLTNLSQYAFEMEYTIKDDWHRVIGFQNVDKLQKSLHRAFIRRTKEEVAKDLPPVIFKDEILEMSKNEEKVFNELVKSADDEIGENTLIDLIDEGSVTDKIDAPDTVMALITRLRQCTTHTGLLSSKIQESTKFERLKEILEEAKENNEKVLVFCQFTKAIELAKDYFKEYNPKIIVGGLGDKVMDIVQEHENTEGFSVIFAQTQTLGVGHSLPNTSNVVFLTILWDYATFSQCFNRCHRITSKVPVTVTNLIMRNTYDECIYDKIYAKKALGDVIIDEKELDACKAYLDKLGIVITNKKAGAKLI